MKSGNIIIKIFVILFFIFAVPYIVVAQKKTSPKAEKEELEKRKQQLTKDIEYSNNLLKETQKEKKSTINDLKVLNRQINSRENVINTINYQIKNIDSEIINKYKEIESLEVKLKYLREEYAAMIRFAYRNRNSYNKLMFVFSSEDFNVAYKRIKYLQQMAEYRQRQLKYIELTQVSLGKKVKDLNYSKEEKRDLLSEEKSEVDQLAKEKSKQAKVVKELSSKESAIRKEIDQKEKEKQQLTAKIKAVIKKEIEEQQRAAAEKKKREAANANKTAAKPTNSTSNSEIEKLTSNFESNQNKLPWPVEQGIIIEQFGVHPHPVLPTIKISNDGIDIKTSPDAKARSIFNGDVVAVTSVYGNYAVIIKHGEYFSVYSNLSSTVVQRGQKVVTKQTIGQVALSDESDNYQLNFQIWKGQQKINPELWLIN